MLQKPSLSLLCSDTTHAATATTLWVMLGVSGGRGSMLLDLGPASKQVLSPLTPPQLQNNRALALWRGGL